MKIFRSGGRKNLYLVHLQIFSEVQWAGVGAHRLQKFKFSGTTGLSAGGCECLVMEKSWCCIQILPQTSWGHEKAGETSACYLTSCGH
jgi:hypothetical protein